MPFVVDRKTLDRRMREAFKRVQGNRVEENIRSCLVLWRAKDFIEGTDELGGFRIRQSIEYLLGLAARLDDLRLAQYAELLGKRRLANADLSFQFTDGKLVLHKRADKHQPHRMRQDLQQTRHLCGMIFHILPRSSERRSDLGLAYHLAPCSESSGNLR